MIDIENIVYTTVMKAIKEKYPNCEVYSEYMTIPKSFPCVVIYESNNVTLPRTQDSSQQEHHASVMYTINVYSNVKNHKKSECKDIANIVDETMQNMKFTRNMFEQMPNADSSIYRIVLTYSAIIEELQNNSYRIYRR